MVNKINVDNFVIVDAKLSLASTVGRNRSLYLYAQIHGRDASYSVELNGEVLYKGPSSYSAALRYNEELDK